jgi:outer membrane protein assembly factor BamA
VLGNLLAPQLAGTALFADLLPRDPFFDDRAAFVRPTWFASAELVQPAFRAAENRLGASLFAHRRLIHGIAVDHGVGAGISATRQLRDRSPLTLAYRFELNRIEAGDVYFCVNYVICDQPTIAALRASRRLSPVSLSLLRERVDEPLGPSAGRRMRVDMEYAAGFTLSDFQYGRLSAEVARYHQLGRGRSVLAGRVRVGWVRPLEGTPAALDLPGQPAGELLHPRKRFYAGGSHSVRGYGENQLGPRILAANPDLLLQGNGAACTAEQIEDGSCDPNLAPSEAFLPRPLGGIGVLQGNLEYRFPLFRQIAGAVFIDGAIVPGPGESTFGTATRAATPGFGVRYRSPVGPVRFDVGIRPAVIEHLPVVTEVVGEDGERRIIRLDTERRWNPVAARGGGFLNEVLARVRIHLAIGEAF